jgi:hypothetical protein
MLRGKSKGCHTVTFTDNASTKAGDQIERDRPPYAVTMLDACILQGFNNDVRDQPTHCIQTCSTIPATTCTQLQAWACIEARGLEPACAGSAQCLKAPL